MFFKKIMLKFKVGDRVKVTAGKDKGREGVIERIFLKKQSVLVPGLNVYKKHVKGTPERKGGIYEITRPIPFSKIVLICPNCKKTTRVGVRSEQKEKIRICKKCGREILSQDKGS